MYRNLFVALLGCKLRSYSGRTPEGLVHFPLVKKSFLVFKRPGEDDPNRFAIGPIDTEHPCPAARHSEIEIPGLGRKTGRIRQQLDRKRVLEALFDILKTERRAQIERRIVPVKFHNASFLRFTVQDSRLRFRWIVPPNRFEKYFRRVGRINGKTPTAQRSKVEGSGTC